MPAARTVCAAVENVQHSPAALPDRRSGDEVCASAIPALRRCVLHVCVEHIFRGTATSRKSGNQAAMVEWHLAGAAGDDMAQLRDTSRSRRRALLHCAAERTSPAHRDGRRQDDRAGRAPADGAAELQVARACVEAPAARRWLARRHADAWVQRRPMHHRRRSGQWPPSRVPRPDKGARRSTGLLPQ